MATSPKTRQITNLPLLGRLTQAASSELDTVMTSVDSEVTPLVQLTTSSTPSLVLTLGGDAITNAATSLSRIISPISTLIPSFAGGTVTFPSSPGGNAVPSAGSSIVINITTGNFLKVGIHLDNSANIVLNTGTQAGSSSGATAPGYMLGTHAIGYVVLQNIGGVIQNLTNGVIFQYPKPTSYTAGLPSLSNGQVWIGSASSAGQLPVAASPTQGAFASVTIVLGAGSIVLDTVQDIRTTATPTFAGIVLSGGLRVHTIATQTTTYAALATDCVIPIDTTGGGFTVTLPASVAGNLGQVIFLKDVGGAIGLVGDALTLAPSGTDTIDGVNASISVNFAAKTSLTLIASATGAWIIV